MKIPELLAPAGSLKSMRHAFAYGADAVYAGQPRYSLRVRNNEFHGDKLLKGIDEAHVLGKKFFLTLNTIPRNSKVKTFIEDLEPVIEMSPDALIMADPGLIMMVRERWPDMPVHLSVQANTVNFAGVKFWQAQGIERVILSRELSFTDIEEIRQECPEMELEVFVHGALCIAHSGRCLLSGYFNHRDPNQGTCTNSCRWDYKTIAASETADDKVVPTEQILSADMLNRQVRVDEPRHPLADEMYLLEEANRPGELMPVFEDEQGTYVMNSRDLRAIEHVQRLAEIGVDCLKIEGRTKSHYYVARTVQAYRQAIDDAVAGRVFDEKLLGVLENLANRGYTDGFFQRQQTQEHQSYMADATKNHKQQFCAEMTSYDVDTGLAEFDVKNKFQIGDKIELVVPGGSNKVMILETMLDKNGNAKDVAPGSGHTVKIPMDYPGSDLLLLARFV